MRLLKALRKPSRLIELGRCRRLTPDWVALTAAYLHLRRRYPLLIRTATGPVELRTKYDVATFWLVHLAHSYAVPSNARLVVDAGANIGCFSLYALRQAPECRVIALEPAPDSFQRLSAMLKSHGLDTRCQLMQAALGDRPGHTHMNLNVESQFRRTGESEGAQVPVTTLEQIVSRYGPIDYLKIDVEGAEYASLLNSPPRVLRHIRRIAMEYHPAEPYQPARLLACLASQGFTLVGQRDDGGGYGMAYLIRVNWKPRFRLSRRDLHRAAHA